MKLQLKEQKQAFKAEQEQQLLEDKQQRLEEGIFEIEDVLASQKASSNAASTSKEPKFSTDFAPNLHDFDPQRALNATSYQQHKQQHLLAQNYIRHFEEYEMKQYESPYFALTNFVKNTLEPEAIGTTFKTEVEQMNKEDGLKQGRHFRAEIAFFCLKTLAKMAPALMKPIFEKIVDEIGQNLFASKSARSTQDNMGAFSSFQETYFCLYEDIKRKYVDLLDKSKGLREQFAFQKKEKVINQKLLDFFIKNKNQKLMLKVIKEIKKQNEEERQKNKERINLEKDKIKKLQLDGQRKNRELIEQEMYLTKGLLSIKYYLLEAKFNKSKDLQEMFKQKIDMIENVKFHQHQQIEEQQQEINDIKMEKMQSVAALEKEITKLNYYKIQAEEKKPYEIQQCLLAYLGMVFRTNTFIKELYVANKASGLPFEANERMQIIALDNKTLGIQQFKLLGLGELPQDKITVKKPKKTQIYLQHLLESEKEQIYGPRSRGVQGVLEKLPLNEVVIRWARHVRSLGLEMLSNIIKQKSDQKKTIELKLIKQKMDMEKILEKMDLNKSLPGSQEESRPSGANSLPTMLNKQHN